MLSIDFRSGIGLQCWINSEERIYVLLICSHVVFGSLTHFACVLSDLYGTHTSRYHKLVHVLL